MLESLNDWTLNIRNGNSTRVAYIDYSKAFDSVCHSKLIFKLSKMGIAGALLKIFDSFLRNRSQKVIINETSSNLVDMCSGVPQGSVLGPILFIVYINDLPSVFPPSVVSKYFADDAKLYTEICNVDDVDTLQSSLDNLVIWSNSWQLSISITKCCTIDFKNNKNKDDTFYDNTIDREEIDNVLKMKDLGVYFDSNLSFKSQINYVMITAKQRIFLLFRCFLIKDLKSLLLGCKSYILSILNYCSPVWSPSSVGDVLQLESVQRMFTKKFRALKIKLMIELNIKPTYIGTLKIIK